MSLFYNFNFNTIKPFIGRLEVFDIHLFGNLFGFKSHDWCGYGYSSTPYSQKSFRNDIQIYRRHFFKFLAFWIVSLRLHGFKDFVFIFDPNRQSIYRNGMIYSSLKFWWSVITFYSLPPPPTPPSLIYIEQLRNEFPITLIHVFFL